MNARNPEIKPKLIELHREIDQRVTTIRTSHPDWLCRRGCDKCCHRLAEIPQLSEAEWHLLQAGLNTLPETLRLSLSEKIAKLAEQTERPITCPLLDLDSGACRVYDYRPLACRTYGFYVERDKGLYCDDIQERVENDQLNDVVWGNQDAIVHQLKSLGMSLDLPEWLALETT